MPRLTRHVTSIHSATFGGQYDIPLAVVSLDAVVVANAASKLMPFGHHQGPATMYPLLLPSISPRMPHLEENQPEASPAIRRVRAAVVCQAKLDTPTSFHWCTQEQLKTPNYHRTSNLFCHIPIKRSRGEIFVTLHVEQTRMYNAKLCELSPSPGFKLGNRFKTQMCTHHTLGHCVCMVPGINLGNIVTFCSAS